jgi:hypothetical protein
VSICADIAQKEAIVTKIRILLVAVALLATPGTIGAAAAQESAVQQDQWGGPGNGYMMGPWMMGADGMTGAGNMGTGMMGWSNRRAAMCSAMGSHIEGRLAYLKAELKITDSQETLWTAYAGASRENSMSSRCTTMMAQGQSAPLSLPDRLDQHEQFMAAHLDALRAMNKALKPLYTALSEVQKKAADQLFWGPMGMM